MWHLQQKNLKKKEEHKEIDKEKTAHIYLYYRLTVLSFFCFIVIPNESWSPRRLHCGGAVIYIKTHTDAFISWWKLQMEKMYSSQTEDWKTLLIYCI